MGADPLAADVEAVVDRLAPLWGDLQGARILVTGGTGFFGRWLLAPLLRAHDRHGLGVHVAVVTRDAARFAAHAPGLAGHPAVGLVAGDVRDWPSVPGGLTHVVHMATDASAALNEGDPLAMIDTIVAGTRAALEAAAPTGARVLLTSSGLVYGPQPPDLTHVPEVHPGGPDPMDPRAAYAEGKRAAETLGAIYAATRGVPVVTARGYAFVGPHLPLDRHFAIGNFLRDGLAGGPIRVNGDGTPIRSYMYGSDLAAWLWTLLLRGAPGRAYNVGAEAEVSIAEAARLVGQATGCAVTIAREPVPGAQPSRYVPSTRRAAEELGLRAEVDLPEAIRRTLAWHRALAAR